MMRYIDWVATKKERKFGEHEIWNKIEEVLTRAGYKNNLGGCFSAVSSTWLPAAS